MSHPKKKSGKNKKQIDTEIEKAKGKVSEINNPDEKNVEKVKYSRKEIVNSIKQKLDQQEIEDTFVDTLESTIKEVVEPVKEIVDSSIDLFSNIMVEKENSFTAESTETPIEKENAPTSTLLEFFQENFKTIRELSLNNAKEYMILHTQNTNLAISSQQKWVESICTQVENVIHLQKDGFVNYKSWFSEMTEN